MRISINTKNKWNIWKTYLVTLICYIWCRSESWDYIWISVIWWSDTFGTMMDGGFDGGRWLTMYTCDGCFDLLWIINKNTLPSLFIMMKLLVSCYMIFVLSNITTFNMHTLLNQYVSKSLSSIDSLKTLTTP